MRLLLAVLIAGCTEHVQLGDDGRIPGLRELSVSPPTGMIAFDDIGAPAQHIAYVATGTFVDGSTRDVTELVDWSTDDPFPGGFATPGDYTASGAAAGHVGIHATSGPIDGAAALTITLTATVVDGVFPPPAVDLFGGTLGNDPTKQPLVRYPADETRFPQAMQPIVFQHDLGTGNDTLLLHFESDVLDLSIITGGDRWQPDSGIWSLIEGSHPNAELALTVEGASSTAPGTLFRAAPITLHFSAATTTDLMYLFSAAEPGVVRGSLAASSTAAIARVAADPHHAVSLDGHLMALGAAEKLSTLDLDSLAQLLPPMAPMGYAAFSPNRTLMLIADNGMLTLRDATTGQPVGPDGGKVPLGGNLRGSHPDWSPDGNFVAITVSDMLDNNDGKHTSIGRLSVDGTTWGALEILVQSTGDLDNNFAPRWGPAGSIAYVHAITGPKDTKNAELRLLRDGLAPVTMALATTRVGTLEVPDTNVTMPSWTTGADGASWLAFVSTRPYGTIRPSKGPGQIWVVGVDLARPDPSFAAFWLPCQDVTAATSNPIWAPVPIVTDRAATWVRGPRPVN